ncbi:unnamed protein product [Heligmosomoides polygyrus]|uniref:Reverse transcriptase domain-containing protein n=1 Tax=Heligmosomoides polygyrus TaxID=6339 RepID=A0A183FVT3_HELPZ|nr:unnamed protein product [Heligmosomoides polygyrus]
MKLERFYKKDHTFHKVIVGNFNAKIVPRRLPEELHIGTHDLEENEQAWSSTSVKQLQLTSELEKLCRTAIKEDLKERRAEVLAEAAEAMSSIRNARRNFANINTKMTALQRPDGTITFSRRAMEKVIRDFYSDLFDSHTPKKATTPKRQPQ